MRTTNFLGVYTPKTRHDFKSANCIDFAFYLTANLPGLKKSV